VAALLLQCCGLLAKGTPPTLESRGSVPGVVLLLVSGAGRTVATAAAKGGAMPALSSLKHAALHCCKIREPADLVDTVLYLTPGLVGRLPGPTRDCVLRSGAVTDASMAEGVAVATKRNAQGPASTWSLSGRVDETIAASAKAMEEAAAEEAERAEAMEQVGLGKRPRPSEEDDAAEAGAAEAAAAVAAAAATAAAAGDAPAPDREVLDDAAMERRRATAAAARAALPAGPLRELALRALRAADDDAGPWDPSPALGLSSALRGAVSTWSDLTMVRVPLTADATAAVDGQGLAFTHEGGPPDRRDAADVDTSDFAVTRTAAADVATLLARAGRDPGDECADAVSDSALHAAPAAPAAAPTAAAPASSSSKSAAKPRVVAGTIPLDREGALAPLAAAAARCPVLNLIAIDCEMVRTDDGLALARLSAVNACGVPVIDRLVRPRVPVRDYVTQYSGITPAMLADDGPATDLETARAELVELLEALPCAVLVGHSLENDLRALRLVHTRVLDTAVLFAHKRGWPRRNKLSYITQRHLGRTIQSTADGAAAGHCSSEDAAAALELTLLRLWRGPAAAMPRAARSARADCTPLLRAVGHPLLFPRSAVVGPPYFVNCYLEGSASGVACDGGSPEAVCRAVASQARSHAAARLRGDEAGASLVLGRIEMPGLGRYSGQQGAEADEDEASRLDRAVASLLLAEGGLPAGTLVVVTSQASLSQMEAAERASDGSVSGAVARVKDAAAAASAGKAKGKAGSAARRDVCTAQAWLTVIGSPEAVAGAAAWTGGAGSDASSGGGADGAASPGRGEEEAAAADEAAPPPGKRAREASPWDGAAAAAGSSPWE